MTPEAFAIEWLFFIWDCGYVPLSDGSWVHINDDMPAMSRHEARLDRSDYVAQRCAQMRDEWGAQAQV